MILGSVLVANREAIAGGAPLLALFEKGAE